MNEQQLTTFSNESRWFSILCSRRDMLSSIADSVSSNVSIIWRNVICVSMLSGHQLKRTWNFGVIREIGRAFQNGTCVWLSVITENEIVSLSHFQTSAEFSNYILRLTRYNLSARWRRRGNITWILTADEWAIHGNENRPDSKNLLQWIRAPTTNRPLSSF